MLGKAKCKILKEIRQKIADENDIQYVTQECTYQGDCSGTCPRCESELRYLERELEKRARVGKQVAVTALCAGMAFGTAGCDNPIIGQDLGGAAEEMRPENLNPTIGPDADLAGEATPGDDEIIELSGDVEALPLTELAGAPEMWEGCEVDSAPGEAVPTAENAFDGLEPFATTFNKEAVSNGAVSCPLFEAESDVQLRALTTYHWNDGYGAVPGMIRIYDVTDGNEELMGSWTATTRGGNGGENVNWDIFPDITLQAGHVYHIIDSDAATWSSNAGSKEMGFVEMYTDEGVSVQGSFSPCSGN